MPAPHRATTDDVEPATDSQFPWQPPPSTIHPLLPLPQPREGMVATAAVMITSLATCSRELGGRHVSITQSRSLVEEMMKSGVEGKLQTIHADQREGVIVYCERKTKNNSLRRRLPVLLLLHAAPASPGLLLRDASLSSQPGTGTVSCLL